MPVRSERAPARPRVLDSVRQDRRRAGWGRDRFRPSWARHARRGPQWLHDTLAVTPVIGTVMVLSISVIGIAAVLTWGLPNIQQTQMTAEVDGVVEQFQAFDQVAEQVMRGGATGKASEAKLNMPSGTVQLDDGGLFVVTMSPANDEFLNEDRFYIQGLDDGEPQSFRVQSALLTNVGSMYAQVARAYLTTVSGVTFLEPGDSIGGNGAFSASGAVDITLATDLWDKPTRIQVYREFGGTDHLIMETWMFPLGALTYSRPAPIGNVNVLVENSAVITESDAGKFMQSHPLATVETDGSGDISFMALFPMLLDENPAFPAVSASGSGSFPLLWALAGNTLRVNGMSTLAVQIKVIGDRGDLWMQHFTEERYDFVTVAPNDDSVRREATAGKPFNLVIMESLIEVTMKMEGDAIVTV